MRRHTQFKQPEKNTSPRFSVKEPQNYDREPAVFSLERVQPGYYCLSSLDQENKAMFSEAMYRRRTMTWNDLRCAGKHGLGCEKIPKDEITAPIPPFITEEENTLLVFRYHGKRAMVGYRYRNVFYVLWFDHDFTLYNHG